MPIEIERKFLPCDRSWRDGITKSLSCVQGYLANTERASVRVRIMGDAAEINVKAMRLGIQRDEYSYPLPLDEAHEMLNGLCLPGHIEKTRHYFPYHGHLWEIDEFLGDNVGLVVAEIELTVPDESFSRPAWLGREVSGELRYYNVTLVGQPYCNWPSSDH